MSMKYLLFLSILASFCVGQEIPSFPTPPNQNSFVNNIEYPINLNTGGISYNVNLLSIPLGSDNLSINLNYSSKGVKVADISNEFGVDWDINLPKVTRVVNGIPDEDTFGYLSYPKDFNVYDLYSKLDSIKKTGLSMTGLYTLDQEALLNASLKKLDLQADKFYFQLKDKKGYFMFDVKNNEIITFPLMDIKISHNLPNTITIQDTDGTEYFFGGVEKNANQVTNNIYTNSWLITKIKNIEGHEINFNYDITYNNNVKSISETVLLDIYDPALISEVNNSVGTKYTDINFNSPYLKQIISNNLKVEFKYVDNNYNTVGKNIDEIQIITSNNSYKYNFKFDVYTSYDKITNHQTLTTQRSFLRSLEKKDNNDKIISFHMFKYYSPNLLPGRYSKKRDLWGYYNNSNDKNTLIPSYRKGDKIFQKANLTVNENTVKYGMLEEITLPEKGSIKFVLEPNTVPKYLFNNYALGFPNHFLLYEEKDDYITTVIAKIITENYVEEGEVLPTEYVENFQINEETKIKVKLSKSFIGKDCISSDTNCPGVYLYGPDKTYSFNERTVDEEIKLQKGSYDLVVNNLKEIPSERKNVSITLEKKELNKLKLNSRANGVRVKSIEHLDVNKEILLKKEYSYDKKNGVSSGDMITLSSFISMDFQPRFFLVHPGYPVIWRMYLNIFVLLNSSPDGYPNTDSFNNISYSEVTEDILDLKENKHNKVENKFFTIDEIGLIGPFANKKLNLSPVTFYFEDLIKDLNYVPSWRQGLLKQQKIYNHSNLVEQNDYIYFNSLNEGKFKSNLSAISIYGLLKFYFIYHYSEHQFLQGILNKKIFYNEATSGQEHLIFETKNYYNSKKHLNLTKHTTTNSKGEVLSTEYQYPPDLTQGYEQSELMQELVDRNMIGNPVITTSKNGNTVLSEQRTLYGAFPGTEGSLILPKFVYQKKGAMSSVVNKDDLKVTYNSYDNRGNLTQYTMENGIPVSIIWGYNGQYPIAKIEGETYYSISSQAETLITASNSTSGLNVNSFNALRSSFPDALITGYIYQPLVGVTMIIQPNGQSEHYKYDAAGRLEEVRNHHGEIIKSFEYNYARP